MGSVVDLNVITTLSLDPDRVLQKAAGKLDRVIVIGQTKEGEEYFASSEADGGCVLWDMERAKLKLLRVPDEVADGTRQL
jgi:hypothetical protein